MTTENVKTADKKPEVYTDQNGKKRVRMVAVDREIIKNEKKVVDEKGKGLWHNIRAKRKRGEPKAKPGDKDYPKTLNIEGMYGRRRDPFKSAQRSAKYKEAEAEYEREKEFLQKRKQQKPVKKESNTQYPSHYTKADKDISDKMRKDIKKKRDISVAEESVNEVAPLIGLAARGIAGAAAGALAKKAAGAAVKKAGVSIAKKVATGAAVGSAALGAKSLLSKDKEKKENVQSFATFIAELTDKQKAEIAARKAKNLAKRGARRGPSKGTKSSEGDWTADQQKKAKPLGFEIGKNDKHDVVHKTLAKAADASHPSLGGRKVTVKINGKSKEMAHKDLQHAVDLHKKLPLGKKAAVMNLIRDKGHDGVTAAANHFRKTYK
jgi:hypothetical protein